MKKVLFLLIALLFVTLSSWAQVPFNNNNYTYTKIWSSSDIHVRWSDYNASAGKITWRDGNSNGYVADFNPATAAISNIVQFSTGGVYESAFSADGLYIFYQDASSTTSLAVAGGTIQAYVCYRYNIAAVTSTVVFDISTIPAATIEALTAYVGPEFGFYLSQGGTNDDILMCFRATDGGHMEIARYNIITKTFTNLTSSQQAEYDGQYFGTDNSKLLYWTESYPTHLTRGVAIMSSGVETVLGSVVEPQMYLGSRWGKDQSHVLAVKGTGFSNTDLFMFTYSGGAWSAIPEDLTGSAWSSANGGIYPGASIGNGFLFGVRNSTSNNGLWYAQYTPVRNANTGVGYCTIQAAITAATVGDIISVSSGTYKESNILINKQLTLQGASQSGVIIAPSAEDIGAYDIAFDGTGTNQQGIMVTAAGVIIKNLTIDGDANNLANGGTLSNHHNYRNGILNYNSASSAGSDNLTVQNVTIKNTRLRGIGLDPMVSTYSHSGHLITNCNISNVGGWQGIKCTGYNVSITGNTLYNMGAGIGLYTTSASPVNSIFAITGNTLYNIAGSYSSYYGHGERDPHALYFYSSSVDRTLTIQGNNINVGNATPETNGYGALGMYCYNADANSEISGNTINTTEGSNNFGIYLGGCAGTTVDNNNFIMNEKDRGICLGRGATIPVPNIISNNSFTSTGSVSGVISEGCAIIQSNNGGVYTPFNQEAHENTNNIITGNTITGFQRGIVLNEVASGTYVTPGSTVNASISDNKISGNTLFGIDASTLTNATPINATNNWWGNSTGPLHATLNSTGTGNPVSNKVSFIPWWCQEEMTSKCSPLSGANAIINTTTGEVYEATELGAALTDAANGQTLYVAAGVTVEGTTYSIAGKTVYIDGSGIPGQSKLSGASPALTVTAGEVIVQNGIEFTQTTDEPTILVTGGKLTIRDCIINESTAGDQSCIKVTGGDVDAGTALVPGNNRFVISGAGSAIDNVNTMSPHLPAIGNDWGNPTGPSIASNPTGTGGAIIGAGKDDVDYDPIGGGPVTTASTVTVCNEATTVDIPIKVSQFSGIGSFSLTFGFTPAELLNPTIVSRNAAFDLSGHEWPAFDYTTDAGMLAAGIYKVSGLGVDPTDGISLSPNATLFTLRFTIGTIASTSAVSFTEDVQGTACEFTGVAPSYVPYGDMPTATSYINGEVIINKLTSNTIAEAQTICSGDIPELISGSAVTGGTISYQWQSCTTGIPADFSNIGTNDVAEDYQPLALSVDTWYRRIATSFLNGVSCPSTSDAVKITVNNVTSGAIQSAQTICSGTAPAELITVVLSPATGDGTLSYHWESSTTGVITEFSDIVSATDETYQSGNLTADTWYRRVATSTIIGDAVTCTATTAAIKVTVNNVTAGVIQSAQNIVYNTAPAELTTATAATGDGQTITYQWESSIVSATTDFSNVATSGTSETYQPGNLSVDTWYRRVATSTITGDPVTCTATTAAIKITIYARKTISGNFTYYNVANTPLTHLVEVGLYKSNILVTGTSTNPQTITSLGAYEFTNLIQGTYEIRATSTHPTTGSINTTDAAQVQYWGVYPYEIQKVRFYAGDVSSNDDYFNSSDAQKIQRNFVNGTVFDRVSPWIFGKTDIGDVISSQVSQPPALSNPTVTFSVTDGNATMNMYGLCTGDFNRSFNPSLAKTASTTLDLLYSGNRQIGNNQEFELPLRMLSTDNVGAVSLILNFPADLVEVQDVLMNSTEGQLDWAVNGSELRIGWNSQTAFDLGIGANLVSLRLKTTDAFTAGNSIRIALAGDPLNELADAQYNVIADAVLGVDVINASALGIMEQNLANGLTLSSYPNPFNTYTMFNYTLPFEGKVTIEIRNLLGETVIVPLNEMQSRGDHTLKVDASNLTPGVYMASIRLSSKNNVLIHTIKLINSR